MNHLVGVGVGVGVHISLWFLSIVVESETLAWTRTDTSSQLFIRPPPPLRFIDRTPRQPISKLTQVALCRLRLESVDPTLRHWPLLPVRKSRQIRVTRSPFVGLGTISNLKAREPSRMGIKQSMSVYQAFPRMCRHCRRKARNRTVLPQDCLCTGCQQSLSRFSSLLSNSGCEYSGQSNLVESDQCACHAKAVAVVVVAVGKTRTIGVGCPLY